MKMKKQNRVETKKKTQNPIIKTCLIDENWSNRIKQREEKVNTPETRKIIHLWTFETSDMQL